MELEFREPRSGNLILFLRVYLTLQSNSAFFGSHQRRRECLEVTSIVSSLRATWRDPRRAAQACVDFPQDAGGPTLVHSSLGGSDVRSHLSYHAVCSPVLGLGIRVNTVEIYLPQLSSGDSSWNPEEMRVPFPVFCQIWREALGLGTGSLRSCWPATDARGHTA